MSRHVYESGSITINGIAFGNLKAGQVEAFVDDDLEGPPEPRPVFKPYEMTAEMTISDEDELDELAWRSVVTPSLEASAALNVLADALLERGSIHGVPEGPTLEELLLAAENGEIVGTFAQSPSVLEQAWEWAKGRAGPSAFERLVAEVNKIQARGLLPASAMPPRGTDT